MLHSEEYLNDSRLDWYNSDFIELMIRRLNLSSLKVIADVGCGMLHWTRILAPYFSASCTIFGIDREPGWIKRCEPQREVFKNRGFDLQLIESEADAIKLPDASVDLVTCQTLLIHVEDRTRVLKEFYRILRQGGAVLCSEPNNLVKSLVIDSLGADQPMDHLLLRVKFELAYAMGKNIKKEGNSFAVEAIPQEMLRVGFEDIRAYLSDRVELKKRDRMDFSGLHFDESEGVLNYARVGGFSETEIIRLQDEQRDRTQRLRDLLLKESFLETNCAMNYLFVGRKTK